MRHHADPSAFESEAMVQKLEHEGELASPFMAEAIALAAEWLPDVTAVGRVLDLGCGPGVATALLADAFPTATVVAADGSPAMLARTAARAARVGIADRVEAVAADLNGSLAHLGRCELAWAAMSLHHARDPVATLRSVGDVLAPDGVLCLVERGEPASVDAHPRLLDAAGYELLAQRVLSTAVPAGHDPARHVLIARLGSGLTPPRARLDESP